MKRMRRARTTDVIKRTKKHKDKVRQEKAKEKK